MNVLLIDDHVLFREGLRHILRRLDPSAFIHEASSVEACFALDSGLDEFDLVLLDVQLPGLRGLDGLRTIQKRFPSSPVVLISGYADRSMADEAMAHGAMGFISKSVNAENMLASLRRVLDGELCPLDDQLSDPASGMQQALTRESIHLTPRQIDVLVQLCKGHSNKGIGRALSMSDNTVRSHVAGIFRALGVKSRAEAIVQARRGGLL
ncbi:MAG TPA: response regulator transcription factor [Burkholderiaceae bacterium]|nr:response regulator transcription factor [Burkholderiaceae bacterium]